MASAPPPSALIRYEDMKRLVDRLAKEKGVPPELAMAMVRKESMGTGRELGGGDWDFNAWAMGDRGSAIGPMQLRPGAREETGLENPRDPEANIRAGLDYLLQQKRRFSDWPRSIAAYNAGASNVGAGAPYAEEVLRLARAAPGAVAAAPPIPPPGGPGGPPGVPPPGMDRLATGGMTMGNAPAPPPGRPIPPGDLAMAPPPPPIPEGPPPAAGAPEVAQLPSRPVEGMAPPQAPYTGGQVPLSIGTTGGINPRAGGGDGFTGFLRKAGGVLKSVLPYIVGGAPYAWGKMVGEPLGRMAEEREKRMEDWKSQREQKTKWENAQVDSATKVMEELQGMNLSDLVAQEKDPNKRQMLQRAADRIAEIGKKYAELMGDPESPGMITPKEASELLAMRQMYRSEIDQAKSAAGEAGAREKGRLSGLEEEAKVAELRRRASEGDTAAQAQLNILEARGQTIDIDIGGGQKKKMSIEQATAWIRSQYYANADRMRRDPNSAMAQAWISQTADVVAMLRVQKAQAALEGDEAKLRDAMAKLDELERQLSGIRSGRFGSSSMGQGGGALPDGYQGGWEE